ncbi:MAG: penicillin-binding protein activator [Gammaproteobacteria bacterium]
MGAAGERASLQPWLSGEAERLANAREILAVLGTVPMERLEASLAAAQSDDWRGWLELSASVRDIRYSAAEQRVRLQAWQQRYAALPALDTASVLLREIEAQLANPGRVALLLPLSGRAGGGGQAVLQGYLAEHYRQLALGETPPQVAITDTGGTPEAFAAAYRRAVEDGSELVIGPLLKEELAMLGRAGPARAPTLALNFLDEGQALPAEVRQFGIDAKDEIAQLVAGARAAGYSRVLLLADESPRAKRLVEEFSPRWRTSGGTLLGSLFLRDLNDYRKELERTMLLDQSRERAETLGRITGLQLETEPRRRADLDLLVMFAEPVASRSLRSLVSFLYAGDLPRWGSSLSYSGNEVPEEDVDLEGLRFLDMPWFGAAESELRGSPASPRGGAERFVALGVDAARLQSRLRLLATAEGNGLAGATGELGLDAKGRIHRRSTWFGFGQGRVVPVEARAAKTQTPTSTEGDAAWNTETEAEESVAPQRIVP